MVTAVHSYIEFASIYERPYTFEELLLSGVTNVDDAFGKGVRRPAWDFVHGEGHAFRKWGQLFELCVRSGMRKSHTCVALVQKAWTWTRWKHHVHLGTFKGSFLLVKVPWSWPRYQSCLGLDWWVSAYIGLLNLRSGWGWVFLSDCVSLQRSSLSFSLWADRVGSHCWRLA